MDEVVSVVRSGTPLLASSVRTKPRVDVIVGGQYGSEGKGQIASYMAKEYDYFIPDSPDESNVW